MPVHAFGSKPVRVLRDRKSDLPEAANGRFKAISTVFSWALEDERPGVHSNPSRDGKLIKTGSTGWHTWTVEEVVQFEDYHAIGTKPRLAMSLLLLTGARRSDVVRLGSTHKKNPNCLVVTVTKNKNRDPITVDIPALPKLSTMLEASQLGEITFIVTQTGVPFTVVGFGD